MATQMMLPQTHHTLNASAQSTKKSHFAYQTPKERPTNTMAQLQTQYSRALADALAALVGGGIEAYAAHLNTFLATLASTYDTNAKNVAAFEIVTFCLLGQYDTACALISKSYPAAMDEDKYLACIGATSAAVRNLSLNGNNPAPNAAPVVVDRRQSTPVLPQKVTPTLPINSSRTPPPAYHTPLPTIPSVEIAGVQQQTSTRGSIAAQQQRPQVPQARSPSSSIVSHLEQRQLALPPPPPMRAQSPVSPGGYNPATYGVSPATAQTPQTTPAIPKRRPVGSPKPAQQTVVPLPSSQQNVAPLSSPQQYPPQQPQQQQQLAPQPLPTPPYSPLSQQQSAGGWQNWQQAPQMYFPPPPPTPAKRTPSPGVLNARRAVQQRPQPSPQERPQSMLQQRPQPTPHQQHLHPLTATRSLPTQPQHSRQRAMSQQSLPGRPQQMQQQPRPKSISTPPPPGHLAAPVGPAGEKGFSGPPAPKAKNKALAKIKNFHKTPAGKIAIRMGTGMAIAGLTGGLIGGMEFGGGDVDIGGAFEGGDMDLGGGEELGGDLGGGEDFAGGEAFAGDEGYAADGAAFEDNMLYDDGGYEEYGAADGATFEDSAMYGEDAGYGAEGPAFEDNFVAEEGAGGYEDGGATFEDSMVADDGAYAEDGAYVEDQYAQDAGTYEDAGAAPADAPTETATEDLPGQVGPCFEDNVILSAAAG